MKTPLVLLLFVFAFSLMNMNYPADDLCIVDKKPLGDKPVAFKYLKSDLKFCSEDCLTNFKNEPAEYQNDGLTCPVCDEEDAKKELSATNNNIKYYFCGKGCKTKFEKKPEKYLSNYENNPRKSGVF